jgi:hypothetical protein
MIPLWILRHVRIRLAQKFAIACFLCLSIVMVITALIRMCLSRYRGWGDLTMQYLLIYIEACIAIIMSSIAAYRAVFVEQSKRREIAQQREIGEQERMRRLGERNFEVQAPPVDGFRDHIRRLRREHSGSDTSSDGSTTPRTRTNFLTRPSPGNAKLVTLLSMIRAIGRTRQESSTVSTSALDSFHNDSIYSGKKSDAFEMKDNSESGSSGNGNGR